MFQLNNLKKNNMKNIIFTISLALVSLASQAQIESFQEIEITEVKLYNNSAQIVRKGKIRLENGSQKIRIENISPFMRRNSIRVKIDDPDVQVYSISPDFDFIKEKQISESQLAKEKSIERSEISIKKMQLKINAIEEQLSFLKINQKMRGQSASMNLVELKKADEYYGTKIESLELQSIGIQNKLDSINTNLHQNRVDLQALHKNYSENPLAQIVIELSSKNRKEVDVIIDYIVDKTGWRSAYELRVEDLAQPIKLVHKAIIHQNTEVPWKDVRISLSTARPSKATLPNLPVWDIFGKVSPKPKQISNVKAISYDGPHRQIYGQVTDETGEALIGASIAIKGTSIGTETDFDGSYRLFVPYENNTIEISYVGYMSQEILLGNSEHVDVCLSEGVQLDELVVVASSIPDSRNSFNNYPLDPISNYNSEPINKKPRNLIPSKQMDRVTFKEYFLDLPLSVQSGSNNKTTQITEYSISAEYEHRCAPKVDPHAYLVARLGGWDELELPSGRSTLFLENTYVGETQLNFKEFTKDTIEVALGKDQAVNVSRNVIDRFNKSQTLGGKRESMVSVQIQVSNLRDRSLKMVLTDQLPLSLDKEIKVESTVSDGVIKENGIVKWKLNILPYVTHEEKFSYTVQYPKNQIVWLE